MSTEPVFLQSIANLICSKYMESTLAILGLTNHLRKEKGSAHTLTAIGNSYYGKKYKGFVITMTTSDNACYNKIKGNALPAIASGNARCSRSGPTPFGATPQCHYNYFAYALTGLWGGACLCSTGDARCCCRSPVGAKMHSYAIKMATSDNACYNKIKGNALTAIASGNARCSRSGLLIPVHHRI